tara:strand:+ start:106 stop:273 length:168 start_codon:yes stop_codon:yes gene_type:complete
MKVEIKDGTNTPLTGWKYWAAIAVLLGASTSLGGEFASLTPLSLFEGMYQSTQCS